MASVAGAVETPVVSLPAHLAEAPRPAAAPAQMSSRAGPLLGVGSGSVGRGDVRVELGHTGAITSEKDERDLRVVAGLLSFDNAKSHRSRFLLQHYDLDWIETGASGDRVFPQLPPGH